MLITIDRIDSVICPKTISVGGARCYGPQCMAWRWADTHKMTGYCGLAGIPLALKTD